MSRRLTIGSCLLLAIGTACSDIDAPSTATRTPDTPSLQGVGALGTPSATMSPTTATINAGSTVQLTATYYNKNGKPTTKSFAWSSSAPGIATVSSTGLVTGVAAGSATITAFCCVARDTPQGLTVTAAVTVNANNPPPPPPPGVTLLAAGDIGDCTSTMDEATANILDANSGTIALLGDNAYPNGSSTDFANCFQPSWGRHLSRMKPSPGNHEYGTANAAGYFGYFGAAAGDPTKGYYSYDLGSWHIVVLNTNSSCTTISCAPGSAQEMWLRSDLAATSQPCILAYWHHPRFSSDATHGNNAAVAPFWDALYAARADIVLNGHAHTYERFGLQDPSQVADANGIREFVVGTGGKSPLYGFAAGQPNSQVRGNSTWGVLKLTLGSGTYSWNFLPVAGSSWTDSGTGSCH